MEEGKKSYDGLSFSKFMLAGSAAGVAEHVAMFPVDTIKTRMQASPQPGKRLSTNVTRVMSSIIRKEGLRGLYSGVGAVAVGAGPSHGVYFVVYEYMKNFLGASNDDQHRPLETGFAASLATIVADGFMTPLDVVKQRLQLANHPYNGAIDCAQSMLKNEGIRPFFRSYNTTVIMNVPFVAIHFAAYESCKKLLRESAEDEGFWTQLGAGGIAGGFAAAATNPLDVVKTRLQTDGVLGASHNSSSTFQVLRDIVKTEGYGALMHGIKPRVLFHAPAAAISWVTYESCKNFWTSLK
jgi:solute carrier family 25 iron transporter 28/37